MNTLPVQRAALLSPTPAQSPWLIEELWSDQAVGILGGEPKCCKSFLALDIAVSVAAGAPCLRRFAVVRSGPVLFFPAEDSLAIVRQRLDGICSAATLDLSSLPLHVITAPSLRLDLQSDRQRLAKTLDTLKPILLILDPLIRLHQVEENDASAIAPLLSYLRGLQRRFQLAVLVVHHAKKDAHSQRPGQALRGSSELHGWGDSNLYLRRRRDQLTLSTEHRAAPSGDSIALQLSQTGSALALRLSNSDAPTQPAPPAASPPAAWERIRSVLAATDHPLSLQQLRNLSGMRTATLCDCLAEMSRLGWVSRDLDGYRLAPVAPARPISHSSPIEPPGNGNGK